MEEHSLNGKRPAGPIGEMRGSDPRKRKITQTGNVSGRWSKKEHIQFVKGNVQLTLGLQKHGKDWNRLKSEVPSRTVVQIRTHSQKFFLRLMKIAPSNQDPMDFVRENPLSYFINIAHGEFSEDSDEQPVENSKQIPANEEFKGKASDINLQVIQNGDGRIMGPKIRFDKPMAEFPAGSCSVKPENIITLNKGFMNIAILLSEVIQGTIQRANNGLIGIKGNDVPYWNFLQSTATQMHDSLQNAKSIYEKVCSYKPAIFTQLPFMYSEHHDKAL